MAPARSAAPSLRMLSRTRARSSARIHPHRIELGLDDLDPDAVFQGAQLFQRFGSLHGRRRQSGKSQQALAPIHVEPDVAPGGRGWTAGPHERHRRPREIQRKALSIDDDLGDVRVVPFAVVVDAPPQRAHHQRRVIPEWCDGLVDHRGLDQRLVALDVHDQIGATATMRSPRFDPCRSDEKETSCMTCRQRLARLDECDHHRSRRPPT